jgi:cytochrome oxidase assembly protein ShyY1
MPWWRATTRLFPGFKPCYKNLIVNRGYYASSEQSPAPSPQSLSSTVNTPAVLPTPAPATTLPALPTLHQQQQHQQQPTAAPSSTVSPRRVAQEVELKAHDDDRHVADEHDAQEHEPDDEDAQSPHSPYDEHDDDDDGGNDDHDSGVGSGQEDALDRHSGDEEDHADHRE